ncbi:MAG: long-chain fatty acid--CoA ligase [Deltaproteobacteria bacterium]|nr:long-chain fatty acid--CoA ligase [Deltaproteobacteria bacterium]HDZ23174.1 long-chain fatty acid--CoA ligase [Desulfobacteraceae bacterium]
MGNRPWQRHYDYDVPTTIRYPRISAHGLLELSAKAYPDKAALNFYGTEIGFWDLRQTGIRMANALAAIGVQKGDRVGIHLPTCPQYVIAYLATLSLGAIVVNLNPMYTGEELKALITDTGVTTLFTFDMVLPNIRPLYQDIELPRVIVTKMTDYIKGFNQSTPAELELEKGWHHFSLLLEGCSDTKLPRVEISPADPALIQFTGGTTGIPKGAVLTHANLVAATLQVSLWGAATTGLTPPERRYVLSVLPYFHVYGNIVAMNWAFFNCATQILIPRFELEEFMGLLAGFDQITFFPAVPTMINAIINHSKAGDLNLDRKLGLLNSGGAPMPVELIDQVEDMGISYSEGWGMSETTSLGVSNPTIGLKKRGGIGIPWPDTDVRLVDLAEGKEDVPKGEPGEIIIKSPLVMQSYWDNPEETSQQLKDGWLHTGDIAVQDEDDYFFIVDRKKDMIIAGGYNIYPREIDEVLYQHPKVADAATIGIPDEYRGETVKAFIVAKQGQTLTEEEITTFCTEKLAPYKRPKIIEFRKALPKSAVGKILRKVLKEEETAKNKGK